MSLCYAKNFAMELYSPGSLRVLVSGGCKSGGAGQSDRGQAMAVVSVITSIIVKETVT